ncbi:MAG: hypothetical protein KGJ79_12480, partial [Alphaproteobacteria bacterium]|nr:hypothetical protein [Alphaproteobacteria bacterium]
MPVQANLLRRILRMTDTSSQAQRDLAGSWMRMLAWWGPGVALIVITGNMGWWWHMAAWSLGLLWLGGLCVANAMHCGRLHCYFTGPLYLALAA